MGRVFCIFWSFSSCNISARLCSAVHIGALRQPWCKRFLRGERDPFPVLRERHNSSHGFSTARFSRRSLPSTKLLQSWMVIPRPDGNKCDASMGGSGSHRERRRRSRRKVSAQRSCCCVMSREMIVASVAHPPQFQCPSSFFPIFLFLFLFLFCRIENCRQWPSIPLSWPLCALRSIGRAAIVVVSSGGGGGLELEPGAVSCELWAGSSRRC